MAEEETGQQKLEKQLAALKAEEAITAAIINNRKAVKDRTAALEVEYSQKLALGEIDEQAYLAKMKELEVRRELLALSEDELRALQQTTEAEKEELKARLGRIKAIEKEIEATKELSGEFDSWGNKVMALVGFGAKLSATWTGGLLNIGAKMKNLQATFAKLKEEGKSTGEIVGNAFAQIGDRMAAMMLAKAEEIIGMQDKFVAGFHKATQASDEMASSVLGASEALRQQGLDMETAYKASQALISTSVAFKNAQGDARDEIIDTVAKLEQAGVSSNTTAAAFDVFTKVLGKKGTSELKKFAKVAEKLDVPLNQFYSEFVTASKKLASRGPQMEKVFINLQAQVRATGASMDTLLGVAEKFDTFDSSAEAVARLNGILGGPYLNSIEMVMMKEDERIEEVRKSLKQSGTVFKNLGHHAQLSVMNAAGITDQAEAMKLLGSSASEYKKIQKEAQIAADKEKNLSEMAHKATTMFDELKFAMMGLVIEMKPFIESIRSAVVSITGFINGMSEGGKVTFFWTMIIAGFMMKVGLFLPLLKAMWTGIKIVQGWIWAWAAAKTALAGATTAAAIALTAIGWTAIVAAITAIIAGIAWLTKHFGWWGDSAEEAGEKVSGAFGSTPGKLSKQQFDKKWKTMHDGGPVEEDGPHMLQKGEYVVSADKVKSATKTTVDRGLMEGMGKAAKGAPTALANQGGQPARAAAKPSTTPIQIVLKLNERDLGSVLFDYPNGVIYGDNDTGKKLNLGLSRQTAS